MINRNLIIEHYPLLNLQVLTSKDQSNNILNSQLIVFIDTDETDLNRTVKNFTIDQPHLYNLSINVEGFENHKSGEIEKCTTGKVFLIGTRNSITPLLIGKDNKDFKILIAEPQLIIPVHNKKSSVKSEIETIWLKAFSNALSGYLVQSYNQFNAQSIKNALFLSTENTNANIKKVNQVSKKDKPIINNKTIVLVMVIAMTIMFLALFYIVGSKESQKGLALTSNTNLSGQESISIEEAKKTQLRELGINPDDLAADLGCFVE